MIMPPVVVEVEVPLAPAEAYALFTAGIGGWWPLATHSVFEAEARDVRFADAVGGAITEVSSAGKESVWGTVVAWEPADRVAFTWHPGRGPDTAHHVEVRFTPTSAGSVVRLAHSGWERSGVDAATMREGYASGWITVLGSYTGAVPVVS